VKEKEEKAEAKYNMSKKHGAHAMKIELPPLSSRGSS